MSICRLEARVIFVDLNFCQSSSQILQIILVTKQYTTEGEQITKEKRQNFSNSFDVEILVFRLTPFSIRDILGTPLTIDDSPLNLSTRSQGNKFSFSMQNGEWLILSSLQDVGVLSRPYPSIHFQVFKLSRTLYLHHLISIDRPWVKTALRLPPIQYGWNLKLK